MKIIFLRHGSVENPKDVVYGRLPGFPLSQKGIEEVEKEAEGYAPESITAIYSSPLKRTLESAEIASKVLDWKKDIIIDERITDHEIYGWEGEPYKEYIEQPNLKELMEPKEKIKQRTEPFLKELIQKHENALVVSHFDTIEAMIEVLEEQFGTPKLNSHLHRGQSITIEIKKEADA